MTPEAISPQTLPGGDESHLKDCMPWMAGQIPNSKLLMVEGALKWRSKE